MKILFTNKEVGYDAWICVCGTVTPVDIGSEQPECEYCRRVKEEEQIDTMKDGGFICLNCGDLFDFESDFEEHLKIHKERV